MKLRFEDLLDTLTSDWVVWVKYQGKEYQDKSVVGDYHFPEFMNNATVLSIDVKDGIVTITLV